MSSFFPSSLSPSLSLSLSVSLSVLLSLSVYACLSVSVCVCLSLSFSLFLPPSFALSLSLSLSLFLSLSLSLSLSHSLSLSFIHFFCFFPICLAQRMHSIGWLRIPSFFLSLIIFCCLLCMSSWRNRGRNCLKTWSSYVTGENQRHLVLFLPGEGGWVEGVGCWCCLLVA